MNHFLRSFLDHGTETSHRTIMRMIMLVFIPDTWCSPKAYSEMEYIVKDKQWFETHIGVEAGDISIFHNGNNPKELCGVTSIVSSLCISLWIFPYRRGLLLQRGSVLWNRGHTAELWHFVFLRRWSWGSEFRVSSYAQIRRANGQ